MYPYNRNTQLYAAPIQAKERTSNPPKPQLAADRRLRELLLLAREEAALLERKYTALLEAETLAGAKDILHTMEIDQKKHQRILRELLFEIFNESFEEEREVVQAVPLPARLPEEMVEDLLLTEMDDIPFFRSLLAAMEEEDRNLWNLLFEILTDKQNHTAALNHLYAKYFAKTSGN